VAEDDSGGVVMKWGTTTGRIRNEPGSITLRNPFLRFPLWTVVLRIVLVNGLLLGLVKLIRRPVLALALVDVVGLVVVAWLVGPVWFGLGLGVAAGGLVVWRDLDRSRFDRWVWWPLRAQLRWLVTYRRWWQAAMTTMGLVEAFDRRVFVPELKAVTSFGTTDVVRCRMLPGQVRDDYTEQAARLARTFGAYDCRVKPVRKSDEVELWMLRTDRLAQPVAAPKHGPVEDLSALRVAVGEDGTWHPIRFLGTHVLVAGATGSGKSNVAHAFTWAMAPALARGLVSLWCVDPKGGMEFGPGRAMFDRFAAGEEQADGTSYETGFADLLEDAVAVMRARQAVLAESGTRLHIPTVQEPLIVVLVDELASLTAYVTDRAVKNRIASALKLLLSQGRAAGVVVVALMQDPGKDVIPFRGLFPTRICLRVAEAVEVDMVLGAGSHARGALCENIPASQPGVGYVAVDGVADPIRVRFPHITDQHINHLLHQLTIRDQATGCWEPSSDGRRESA
jgi:S-DNA-T family DNA segregation ATPase FtsK/SpoIIIE